MAHTRLYLLLTLLILALIFVPGSGTVSAQEPTPAPTATATPAYIREVPLSSGDTVVIHRSITYGDIAIVTVGIFLLVGMVLRSLLDWSGKWLK